MSKDNRRRNKGSGGRSVARRVAARESSGKARKQVKARFRANWKAIAVLLGLVSLSFAGLAAYKQSWNEMHDLTVVGNGVPTVVQVHDPTCPQCRELKDNTQAALTRVDGEIQYRIADLGTAKGRTLAARHGANKVTLLTFDGAGNYLSKYSGVMGVDSIERLLTKVAKRKAD